MDNINEEITHNSQPENDAEYLKDFAEKFGKSTQKYEYLTKRGFTIDASRTFFVQNYNLVNEIKNVPAPLLEIGGPTDIKDSGDVYLTALTASGRKLIISNITPGQPIFELDEEYNFKLDHYEGKVDLQTDGTLLGIADNSLGLVFSSCVPIEDRKTYDDEIKRVLKKDGLFIIVSTSKKEIFYLLSQGFDILELLREEERKLGDPRFSAVFKKQR